MLLNQYIIHQQLEKQAERNQIVINKRNQPRTVHKSMSNQNLLTNKLLAPKPQDMAKAINTLFYTKDREVLKNETQLAKADTEERNLEKEKIIPPECPECKRRNKMSEQVKSSGKGYRIKKIKVK